MGSDCTTWGMDSCLTALFFLLASVSLTTSYNVGVGRADITGPAAEIGMMGLAEDQYPPRVGSYVRPPASPWRKRWEENLRELSMKSIHYKLHICDYVKLLM